ncbi:hypothetical protein DIPPA_25595 [Diplonema papillatum]|nr:hypothetical protein DIPPA_01807 [Diplonema papillatum]KAJ9462528.1 hypothetical protein DIPPA_25595 [Diplonema papillatum]
MASEGEMRTITAESLHQQLKGWMCLSGDVARFEAVLHELAAYVDSEGLLHCGNLYARCAAKMAPIRPGANVEAVLELCAERGFAAYVAEWAMETPKNQLDIWVRKTTREDGLVKPFKEIRRAMEKEGLKGHVVRRTGAKYEVKLTDDSSEAQWCEFAGRLDLCGLGVQYQGTWINTVEGQERRKRERVEKEAKSYGAVGLDSHFARFEVNAILSEEGWKTEDVQVRPVYALGRGTFRIEGLTEEQQLELARGPYATPFGSTVRFGTLEHLVPKEPQWRRASDTTPKAGERSEQKTQEGPTAADAADPPQVAELPEDDEPTKIIEDADPKPTNKRPRDSTGSTEQEKKRPDAEKGRLNGKGQKGGRGTPRRN